MEHHLREVCTTGTGYYLRYLTLRSDILIPQPDGIPEPTRHHDGQDVYFEILELQPVLVSVSFVRNLSTANSTTGR